MSKDTLLFFVGIVLVFTPFLGVPAAWKTVLFVAAGALTAIIALLHRYEARIEEGRSGRDAVLVERGGEPATLKHNER